MLLNAKVIIVTGGGGGLGAAISRICHREGATVVIADIRVDDAIALADSLGSRALAQKCDVQKNADMKAVVAATIEAYGKIDGLVNNAGVNFVKPFMETTDADWDRITNINLRPAFFFTQYVCEQMLRQKPQGGSIVNISSVHSLAVLAGSGPYDAAKWGVVGLGKAIAIEMAPHNIRVNALSPGLLNTQIWKDIREAAPSYDACEAYFRANIPIERVIEPEEIAEVAAFMLSDRSRAMTGANLLVDGGMTSQLISREPYQSKVISG